MSVSFKRVLVIDGCSFRGLGPLYVLQRIMQQAAIKAGTNLRPCEVFDLICGSSVGGLLAILLGRLGMELEDAIKAYESLGKALFGNSEGDIYRKLLAKGGKLDSELFDEVLKGILQQHAGPSGTPMFDDEPETFSFVTVAAGKPEYLNRTHAIRSYPTPKGLWPPPPEKHTWTIFEAVKATMAATIYAPPFSIQSEHEFTDSSFSSFMNPLDIAKKECISLWGEETPLFIISLGTSLQKICPNPTTLEEANPAKARFVEPFADRILDKLGKVTNRDALKPRATYIARQLVIASSQAQLVHQRIIVALASSTKHQYYRLDPPTCLSEVDICDCFGQKIEASVNEWAEDEGNRLIERIIEDLPVPSRSRYGGDSDSEIVEHNVEELRNMEPPKPVEGTVNFGYNPVLDEKRPDNMKDYLLKYHILFIVDDSKSMNREHRWDDTKAALLVIADYALEYYSDEVDVMFLNSQGKGKAGVRGSETVRRLFDNVELTHGTPTGRVLREVLKTHINRLDEASKSPEEYIKIRPLDIIFLTDGRPDSSEKDDPKLVLADAIKRMKAGKHHPNSIGIQFVQIGNDSNAKKGLMPLIHGDNGSMVDTVPYNPNDPFNAERLQRIILGGIHPNIRALTRMPIREKSRGFRSVAPWY